MIATEELGGYGPTGRLLEVELAELQDYGGNTYGRATTARGMRRVRRRWRDGLALRWIPIRTGRQVRDSDWVDEVIP